MNVVLVGYRGAGKSAIAAALGDKLGWPVLSTDRMVEERVGCSIASFVEVRGWPAFREVEGEVVRAAAARDGVVIDTGGGAILDPASRAALRVRGLVIWLTATPATLAARIGGDPSRPSLRHGTTAEAEIVDVLAEREPLYRRVAQHRFATDSETVEVVAGRIQKLVAARDT